MQLQLIQKKIFEIRGQKVMLDRDLAELYEVPTKSLNLAVKRNLKRFPDDFMFQLSEKEFEGLRFQIETLKKGRGQHRKYLPYAFTEQGVAMLSGIINSAKAIEVNISIMRAFVLIRHVALNYSELAKQIKKLEKKFNKKFSDVYEALDLLLNDKQSQMDWNNRNKIGFKKQ